MFEDVASQHRADDDTTETIEVVNGYSGCEETIVGSHTCHHNGHFQVIPTAIEIGITEPVTEIECMAARSLLLSVSEANTNNSQILAQIYALLFIFRIK